MGKSSPSNRATEVRSAGDQRWRQARMRCGKEKVEMFGRWWWKDSNEEKKGRLLEGQR